MQCWVNYFLKVSSYSYKLLLKVTSYYSVELFLRDRRFRVHIGAWRTQVNGLPQGSVAITNTLQPLHQ